MTVLKGFDKRGLHDYILSQSKRGDKTMSAPKGFYRIALVLNLIAIMAAFYVGYSLHHKTWRFANWPWSFDNWISVTWGGVFAFIPVLVLIYVICRYGTGGFMKFPENIRGFKRFPENIMSKMNLAQKVITGISVGLILFIFSFVIAENFYHRAFELEETWLVWVIFVTVAGYFEYKLFS